MEHHSEPTVRDRDNRRRMRFPSMSSGSSTLHEMLARFDDEDLRGVAAAFALMAYYDNDISRETRETNARIVAREARGRGALALGNRPYG